VVVVVEMTDPAVMVMTRWLSLLRFAVQRSAMVAALIGTLDPGA
jgi:hypothetical protein